jgi:hypothetical protein
MWFGLGVGVGVLLTLLAKMRLGLKLILGKAVRAVSRLGRRMRRLDPSPAVRAVAEAGRDASAAARSAVGGGRLRKSAGRLSGVQK